MTILLLIGIGALSVLLPEWWFRRLKRRAWIRTRRATLIVMRETRRAYELARILERGGLSVPDAFEAVRRWGFTVDQIERELHATHGRGTAEDGPDGSDCGCRGTEHQLACANTGCGFCLAAAPRGPQ